MAKFKSKTYRNNDHFFLEISYGVVKLIFEQVDSHGSYPVVDFPVVTVLIKVTVKICGITVFVFGIK